VVQDQKKEKVDDYIEALKKGGINEKAAKQVLDKWKEVGQEADPASLRKLFAKQSFGPVAASGVQASDITCIFKRPNSGTLHTSAAHSVYALHCKLVHCTFTLCVLVNLMLFSSTSRY
jgi:hypothetical protein